MFDFKEYSRHEEVFYDSDTLELIGYDRKPIMFCMDLNKFKQMYVIEKHWKEEALVMFKEKDGYNRIVLHDIILLDLKEE